MSSTNTANIFERMLARWGWKGIEIGRYTGKDGAVCSIQCLREEEGNSKDERLFLRAANNLYPRPSGLWTDIPEFNDYDGRTPAQLVAVAKEAARLRDAGILA